MNPAAAARPATRQDTDRIVEILVSAFDEDPTWRWAFPDDGKRAQQHQRIWSIFAGAALRHPYVFLTENEAATAIWIPPSSEELNEAEEAEMQRLIEDELASDADRIYAMFSQFDEAHPRDQPHFYLSLLGTHADQRGHGYGLGLLAQNLQAIDQLHQPCYLEASSEVNVPLYSRFGFVVRDRFQPQPGGPIVTTMWRDAQ